ncbi:hypothetical protein [Halodesulfovibrio spirochaetisodalis]|uniref:Uncharacterized protein n=1 Tax=Halodesulfovibrio spirochaetisodalis TaxID=1560234 RepID=A0A1B7XJQ2_9BACT|nr:hypothetical protein [Halodesulfovibrio spirochaetisodalis]OBQ55757.1 hypothetical protein SP90_03860 [Halodesulfovibrio spirochaetisodalis]
MHHISVTNRSSSLSKRMAAILCASALCTVVLMPSLTVAKKTRAVPREDTVIGTGSPDISITEDPMNGDRILRATPPKQKEEECNKYTNGQYPIILDLDLRPNFPKHKK